MRYAPGAFFFKNSLELAKLCCPDVTLNQHTSCSGAQYLVKQRSRKIPCKTIATKVKSSHENFFFATLNRLKNDRLTCTFFKCTKDWQLQHVPCCIKVYNLTVGSPGEVWKF